jgi:excisionase family DNA binding protein
MAMTTQSRPGHDDAPLRLRPQPLAGAPIQRGDGSARGRRIVSRPDEVTEGQLLLDVSGAAAYLGVNEAFVRRLVLERRVRYYKVGKFVRFRLADLDAFVDSGCMEPQPVEIPSNRPRPRRRPTH